MNYHALSEEHKQEAILSRLHTLEGEHFDLELRMRTAREGEVADADEQRHKQLEEHIDELRALLPKSTGGTT